MAILKVSHLGHPVLRKTAAKIDPAQLGTAEMQRLIDDMIETMREYDGIGLAAPQVHVSQQLAVINGELMGDDDKVPEILRRVFTLVNPVVRFKVERKFVHWEGCLSVPGLRGKVPRVKELEVEALGRDGNPLRFVAHGYLAAVVQHETDHLGGRVYLDRMPDLRTLTYLKEYRHHVDTEDDSEDELAP